MNDKCKKCRKPSEDHWCDDCYYPGIDDDWEEFQELLAEGYSRADAAVRSGWLGIEEI